MANACVTRCVTLGASLLIAATVSTSAATSAAVAPRPKAIPLLGSCTTVAQGAFVGIDNCNVADSPDSVVVGGLNNAIQAGLSNYSAIVAGSGNTTWTGTGTFIGSGFSNFIGAFGKASGGDASLIVGGESNSVFSSYASILGGLSNNIGVPGGDVPQPNSDYSFVGGGMANNIYGIASAIVGGEHNISQARQDFIGGGYSNSITVTTGGGPNGAGLAVISGGSYNTIAATTSGAGYFGVVGGGTQNTLTGPEATIAGGYANSASGIGAAIPGGSKNVAAGYDSVAAGTNSDAATDGSFVFSDDAVGAKQLVAAGTNQYLVRASGGVAFYSSPSLTSGVVLRAGSGSWASLSDRASKTDIVALDPAAVLAKVASLPVSEWSYRTETAGIRHIGPMAQDFYAAFGIGEDDSHIAAIDEEGVALAAIKALHAENEALRAEHVADEVLLANLERRLDALAGK